MAGWAACAVALAVVQSGTPAQAAPRSIRVTVSEAGFVPRVITVHEGELVELTFVYGDGHLEEDNPHILFLEGLGVESSEISRSRPESTVRFVAEKSGRIRVACKLYCIGHERLQSGIVEVRPAVAAGGEAPVAEPSRLELAVSHPEVAGAPAALRARLTTGSGEPVEGVTVRFEQMTEFIAADWVEVGAARTDARGVAFVEYLPFGGQTEPAVRAVFDGNARYEASQASGRLQVPQAMAAWNPEEQAGLPFLGSWLLWLVLGSIWLVFGYVGTQIWALSRDGRAKTIVGEHGKERAAGAGAQG